jgi:RecA/RadA recombinase
MAKKTAVKKAAPKKAAPKKKTRQPSIWVGNQRDASLDSMFAAIATAVSDQTGMDGILLGDVVDKTIVGLPFPALVLRYLFQSVVLPLGRIVQLAGKFGSCKSALLYEIMRWHASYGGGSALAECENKDASMMRAGIMEYNEMWLRRIEFGPADTLQEWQKFLTSNLLQFKTVMDAPGGPGRTIPICMGIDSLTATDSETEIAKVEEAGHSSIGYATQANLITRYMRQGVVKHLRGYPFTIVGTNHLKNSMEQSPVPGVKLTKTPGGDAVNFMATFLLEMERVKDIATQDYDGIRVKIKMAKNSIGPSRKTAEAQLLWWQAPDPNTGNFRQRFVWDWDTASVELLLSFTDPKSKNRTLGNAMKEIHGIVRDTASTSHSRVLGYDSPVPHRVLGAALERRLDLLDALYPMLGISKYSVFQPGLDYRVMLEQATKTLAEAQPIYNTVEMPTLHASDSGTFAVEEDPTITEMEAPAEDTEEGT